MKTAFLVIMLAVMVMSVKSRGISYRRRFKDADFVKAFMNDPAPADCAGCFQDCYLAGDDADQINICNQECQCNSNDQADLNDAFMNDPAPEPDCPGCFQDCYYEGDDGNQINTCIDECSC